MIIRAFTIWDQLVVGDVGLREEFQVQYVRHFERLPPPAEAVRWIFHQFVRTYLESEDHFRSAFVKEWHVEES